MQNSSLKMSRRGLRRALLAGLCVVVCAVFAGVSFVVLQPVQENIAFVERELEGLETYSRLLPELIETRAQETYAAIYDIGNTSNLILDPELGSYYLVRILIRSIPNMLLSSDASLSAYHRKEIEESIHTIGTAGIPTATLQALHAKLEASADTATIHALYLEASSLLKAELTQRLDKELTRKAHILIISAVLFLAFCTLLALAVRYYLKNQLYQAAQERLKLLDTLEKTNKELEHFSYFTAHDLKEPVRTIACFASLLEETIPAADAQKLTIIKQAALRIEQLIRDVFSYLSHEANTPPEEISLTEMMAEIEQDLQAHIQSTRATLHYQGLPSVYTRRVMLRRVLQNLITNALRYHAPETPPRINITATTDKTHITISVRDNGVGFDMAYADTIFEPFKRLHDASESGSGIGLSLCRKFITELGGTIWAHSSPGEGATFFFTLPTRPYP